MDVPGLRDSVVSALKDPAASVRREALRALEQLGLPDISRIPLDELLRDQDGGVRSLAAWLAGALGHQAEGHLTTLLEAAQDPDSLVSLI